MPEVWIDSKSRRRMRQRRAQPVKGGDADAGDKGTSAVHVATPGDGDVTSPGHRIVKLLILDPASRKTGYAVMTGLRPEDLLDGGILRGSEAEKYLGPVTQPWLRDVLMAPELHAVRRIDTLVADVEDLIREHQPDLIVIEVPSGLCGTGSKKGASGSLTTYGHAAGAIRQACRHRCPGRVAPVTERQWTVGSGGKEGRQYAVVSVYGPPEAGRYDPAQDKDFDLSDAISLGRWFILEHGRKLA